MYDQYLKLYICMGNIAVVESLRSLIHVLVHFLYNLESNIQINIYKVTVFLHKRDMDHKS